MSELFGVDISGLVAEHVGPGVFPAVLIVSTTGTRVAGSLTQGTASTETSYSGRGFVDTYSNSSIDGTLIQRNDRKIVLIADTFPAGTPAPKKSDKITIQSNTWNVVGNVGSDPANAIYECQSRR